MKKISDKKYLACLFLLVFVSALFWRLFSGFGELKNDAAFFHETAMNLSQGKGFNHAGNSTMTREPGYSFFLAINYKIFGINPDIIFAEQIILLFLIAVIIFFLGRKIFDEFTGRISAMIVAIYPIFGLFAGKILSEILAVFLVTFFVFIFYLAKEKKLYRYYVFSAIIFSFLILIKSAFSLLGPFAILYIFIGENNLKQKIINASVFFLIILIILTPWLIRNYLKFDEISFASRSGVLFYQRAVKTTFNRKEILNYLISSVSGEYFVRRFIDEKYNFERDGQAVKMVGAERQMIQEKLGLTEYEKVDKIMRKDAFNLIKNKPISYFALGFVELNNLNSPAVYYENHFSIFHDQVYRNTLLKTMGIILLRLFWYFFIFLVIYGMIKIFRGKKIDAFMLVFTILSINLPIFFLLGYPRFLMPVLPFYFLVAVWAAKLLVKKYLNLSNKYI